MSFLRPDIRRILRLGADDTAGRSSVRRESDVDEEIRHHITSRVEQLVRQGHAPADAEREARRRFGEGSGTVRALYATANDRSRHMRMRQGWSSVVRDTRYAMRRILREPMTTAFIVVTLALGIGANVTSFSLIDHLLLSGPAHVRDPERVVRVYRRASSGTLGTQTAPWLPFDTYRSLRAMRLVAGVEAYRIDDAMVGERESARMRRVARVTPGLFRLLGVRPALGRFPLASEDGVNGPAAVVLSDGLWRSDYGGNRDAIGKTLVVRGALRTIVGVAPEGFTGPQLGRVDVWTLVDERSATSQNWSVIARVNAGVTVATASAEADAARLRSMETQPEWMRRMSLLVAPQRYDDNARESTEAIMARWLATVSLLILLIACANVVNLMLARIVRRRRELAIRVALGSGRAGVARLVVIEGMLIALASAIASFGVTALIEPAVRRGVLPGAGWTFDQLSIRGLIVVAIIAIAVGGLVGVIPALQAGNAELSRVLRGGGRDGGSRSRVRSALTVTQAAISVALLVGAGLFLRSLAKVRAVDLGIQPDRVLTVVATYPPITPKSMQEYGATARERARRLVATARILPGVEHASVSVGMPLGSGTRLVCFGSRMSCGDAGVTIALWAEGPDSIPTIGGGGPYITAVSDGYFETAGTRLLAGRGFAARDREGTERVAVVSAAMARAVWPGRAAVGRCLRIGATDAPCTRVVGVASDVHRTGVREETSLGYYVPLGQEEGFTGTWLLIRPGRSSSTTWPALRAALLAADPSITALDMHALSEALDGELRPLRLGMATLAVSAVLALLVAALGLYSVMAYSVSWRSREIGVRIALGATASMIITNVVGAGSALAAVGIVGGLLIAAIAKPWLQSQLFETSASDPIVFGGAAIAMLLVAVIACWIPARRAARINPINALQSD